MPDLEEDFPGAGDGRDSFLFSNVTLRQLVSADSQVDSPVQADFRVVRALVRALVASLVASLEWEASLARAQREAQGVASRVYSFKSEIFGITDLKVECPEECLVECPEA